MDISKIRIMETKVAEDHVLFAESRKIYTSVYVTAEFDRENGETISIHFALDYDQFQDSSITALRMHVAWLMQEGHFDTAKGVKKNEYE